MNPTISVVICFYREGSILKETITSVLNQSFTDWELVLVDNNATEETREVATDYAKNFPGRIRIVHEPEQGICSARNKGITESAGEYIALIDGDDMMRPDRLERQLERILKNPGISIVGSHFDLISHDGKEVLQKNLHGFAHGAQNILQWKSSMKKLLGPMNLSYLPTFDMIGSPFMLFRKEAAKKAGLMDLRMNPRDLEDFLFCMRMFEIGPFSIIPEPLTLYRAESENTRKHKFKEKHQRRSLVKLDLFYSILWEGYGKNYPQNKPVFQQLQAFHLINIGCHLMKWNQGWKMGRSLIRRGATINMNSFRDHWRWYIKSFFPRTLHSRFFDFEQEQSTPLDIDNTFINHFFQWPHLHTEPIVNSDDSHLNT